MLPWNDREYLPSNIERESVSSHALVSLLIAKWPLWKQHYSALPEISSLSAKQTGRAAPAYEEETKKTHKQGETDREGVSFRQHNTTQEINKAPY